MLHRPLNWMFNFIEEINLFLFSCDWREAFKKEKKWDKDDKGCGGLIIGA